MRMSSSILNKIRILKPRRNANKKNVSSKSNKSVSKKNGNAISTSQVNETPPLLKPAQTISSHVETQEKTVKVYVVSVPNLSKQHIVSTGDAAQGRANPTFNTNSQSVLLIQQPQPSNNFNKSVVNGSLCSIPNSVISSTVPSDNAQKSRSKKSVSHFNEAVSCFLCPMAFESIQDMREHYLSQHKQKRRNVEDESNAKNIEKAARQMEEEHKSKDGEPKCPVCSIYFKTKEEVKTHMSNVHTYECSECQKLFYTLYQFTDHKCVKSSKIEKLIKIKPKPLDTNSEVDPLALPTVFTSKNAKISDTSSPVQSTPQSYLISSSGQLLKSTICQTEETSQPFSNMKISPSIFFSQHSHSNTSTLNSNIVSRNKKSFLNYSMDELTSKELNEEILEGLAKNPNISINKIEQRKRSYECDCNEYVCGRCNVLCDDKKDYLDHIKLCFRLSNVSIIPSDIKPRRLLKLNSQCVSSKENSSTSGINKKLLNELKSSLGTTFETLFHPKDYENSNSNLSLDCHLETNSNQGANDCRNLNCIDIMNERNPHLSNELGKQPLSKNRNPCTSAANAQPPMVIIPINSNENNDCDKSLVPDNCSPDINNACDNHCLNLETPKSDSNDHSVDNSTLTSHNLIFERGSRFLETSLIPNNERSSRDIELKDSPSSSDSEELHIKCEPLSPMLFQSEEYDSLPTLELCLSNDDIKMEIEEECILDNY